jgi:site-specific recombinase XerD
VSGPEDPVAEAGDALVLVPDGAETTEPGASAALGGGLVPQARPDAQLLALWLFGRSPHTQRAYRREAARFLAHAGRPLREVTLGDVQAFATALAAEEMALTPASQARALAAVKSLLAFGHRLGYLPFDVGGAVRLPRLRGALAERILSEADVHRLLALEPDARNRTLLRLAYAGGLRVSELVALRWRDLRPRDNGEGQVTVYGKGGKTRAVLLPATVWRDLLVLREAAAEDGPVFRSRKGGALTARQAQRLVDAAARRAGLRAGVSPHWLRHAHATPALERGAPIHVVQATLGHASVATTGRYLHARPTDSSARYLAVEPGRGPRGPHGPGREPGAWRAARRRNATWRGSRYPART